MSSTTSSPSGFLSSPRAQQRLMWLSAVVLVAGVAVFLAVYFSRGSNPALTGPVSTVQSGPSQTSHPTTKPPKGQVPASRAALQVARTFLETAVVRKNLDAAYGLVGPLLKGGVSRAEWRTGTIPVPYFPAANAKTAPFVVNESQPKSLILEVLLKAVPGAKIAKKTQPYKIGLNLVGKKWIVTTAAPEFKQPVRANPYNN